jgi:hypothetical protein
LANISITILAGINPATTKIPLKGGPKTAIFFQVNPNKNPCPIFIIPQGAFDF